MSLYAALTRTGPSGFGYGSTAAEVTEGLDLSGKTILLTGCTSGIGEETLRVLTLHGAHVLGTARTEEKARRACAPAAERATPLICELSDPTSIRRCVDAVKRLDRPVDALICNAGIMALPQLQQQHGIEAQFFTNHIGHFMLVTGLLDQLADDGRVVMVSSTAQRAAPPEGIQFGNLSGDKIYQPWRAYGQSKLANLLFARQLAKRLEGSGKTANAIHPGVIKTKLGRHMNAVLRVGMELVAPLAFKNVAQGAATQCYVAVHPAVASVSGKYFADCNEAQSTTPGKDMALAARLWEASEQIVAGLPA